jgi:hypothetical protein
LIAAGIREASRVQPATEERISKVSTGSSGSDADAEDDDDASLPAAPSLFLASLLLPPTKTPAPSVFREPEGAASGTPAKKEGLLSCSSASSSPPDIAVFVARETPPPLPLRLRASEGREGGALVTKTRNREPWGAREWRRKGKSEEEETAEAWTTTPGHSFAFATLDAAAAAARRIGEQREQRESERARESSQSHEAVL